MEQKKIVVIGGGLAGLTAAIYGAKSGFSVELYEKNAIVGGECTGWDRQGYHIDNCIHWMLGTNPKTNPGLYKIWKEVGALGSVEIIQPDRMYTSELNGQSITLWQDIDRTEREMIALSPADAAEIKSLLKSTRLMRQLGIPCQKPGELMGPLDLLKMGGSSRHLLKLVRQYEGMDNADLAARFQHPLLRCLLTDFCPPQSTAASFPMMYGSFVGRDGGIPRGGSRAMALRMGKRLLRRGGQLHTNISATKIEVSEGRAQAVLFDDGQRVAADYVICACDPDYTFAHLLDEKYMDPLLRQIYIDRAAYPVFGMFQAAYAVDSKEDLLGGDIMMDSDAIFRSEWTLGRMSVKTFAYEPSFAPPGKQLIQVLMSLSEDSYDYWMGLYTSDRAAYQAKKEELAGLIRQGLEQRFPGYQGKLTLLDAWTPATYRRYCNAYKGYNQAYIITKNSARNPYPSALIPGLENVVHANQWFAAPGGVSGAAMQGKFAIQRILHKEGRKVDI